MVGSSPFVSGFSLSSALWSSEWGRERPMGFDIEAASSNRAFIRSVVGEALSSLVALLTGAKYEKPSHPLSLQQSPYSLSQGRSQDLVSGGGPTHFGGGPTPYFSPQTLNHKGPPLCTFGYLRISGGGRAPPPPPPLATPLV